MGELALAERLTRALEQGAQGGRRTPKLSASTSTARSPSPIALDLCGDHVTYQCGWMTGAFESARRVVLLIHGRA
jgi:hypothetical protein